MKTRLFLVLIAVFFLILSAGCTAQEDNPAGQETDQMTAATTVAASLGYSDVSVSEAKKKIENMEALVVDVSPVWANGHIPGAVNMPLSTIDSEIIYLSTENKYLVYCHSDSASIQGAETFVNNGLGPVYRLEGNYQAWTDAGYPVEYPMYTNVTAEMAKSMMNADPRLVIVDVSPAYDLGHIPGAISVPLSNIELVISTLDKSAPYLIYCHSDSASIQGTEIFMNTGFNPVYRLEGNYQAWVDAGYPVQTGT